MNQKQINLTPSAVNKYIKSLLEENKYLRFLSVEGEISNFKTSSGHFYFSIKDDLAQINCVMFNNKTTNLTFVPKDGMNVVLTGRIYHNVKTGYYSINVDNIIENGIGKLQQEYEKLKRQLQQEGLFDAEYKKPIKPFNQKIALITAPTSAAIKDMLTTLKRRNPLADIIIIPTIVQGVNAKDSICDAINFVNEKQLADVMIVGRGGGSIEDLWAFNEEDVARCVFNSQIPIISCVGHETDFTIIDFVADLRAPTPTAAAELVSVDIYKMQQQIDLMINNSAKFLASKTKLNQAKLDQLVNQQCFLNPLIDYQLNFDYLNQQFIALSNQFKLQINHQQSDIKNQVNLLNQAIDLKINQNQKHVSALHQQLDALNPLSILSRGYSVVSKDEKIISDVNNLNINDLINIKLANGKIDAKIINTYKE